MEATTVQAATEVVENAQNTPILTKGIGPELLDQAESNLPEKFKGKSVYDVAESYSSLESEFSRTKAQVKELEEKARKAEMYEQMLAQQQVQTQQPIQTQQIDPNQEFNQLWEQDPALAVKSGMGRLEQKLQYAMQDLELKSNYERAKSSYSDFNELEPVMKQIATELLPLVKADQVSNPVTLDVLYALARAKTEDARVRRAQESGMQQAAQARREKSAAYMEGSSPVGQATKSFEDMTLEEMARELGRVQR
jgi:hypothetical protein